MRLPTPIALLLSFALPWAAALPGQSVACEKYRLPNGLTVILHEDHKVPRVVVDTWVRVGAKDEPLHRSGFAHLFEHLMFMGTDRVPGNGFDTIMEGAGGANNASTTEDRTNYFSHGPAEILPTLLWLDADRLEDIGRAMDQAKLDRQREVVRNEIRETVENAPYGRVERVTFQTMFPEGHPYHDSTYGTAADLEAATVDDARDFFATFYVPNNASLVIAGDFVPQQVKPLVEKMFGGLPRAPEPTRRSVAPAKLERVVRATLFDKVQLPLVKMVWHAPPDGAEGTASLELLAEVLAAGKDSRLYRRLVEREKCAVDVSAFLDGLALGSLFAIEVYAATDADLGRVEAIVDEELDRVRSGDVTAEEVQRRQIVREVDQVSSMQDLTRIADQLNHYEFVWGEPDSFARDLARYRAVTPDSVRTIAGAVLDPQRRAILRVLPVAAERPPSARDERPPDFATRPFRFEEPAGFRLRNGMRVLCWQRADLPIVAVRLLIAPGAPLVDPAHAGSSALAADLLGEGTGALDGARFTAAMSMLGARFEAWVDHETANAWLFVAKRNFAEALHHMADAVERPRLLEADFERVRRVQLGQLQAATEQPATVAARVARAVWFGASDPYGWPAAGTPDSVAALTFDDVRAAYRSTFSARGATLLVAGDVGVDEARALLEAEFGGWPAAAERGPTAPLREPAARALRLVIVDRPDAPQTAIHLMTPATPYRDPARIRLQVLGEVLGGGFTSRLNQNLREQHGYSYGAATSFALGPWRGWFTASASVETQVTGPALKELLAELARLRRPEGGDVTAEEVDKVRRSMRTEIAASFARLDGVLATAAELVLNDLPFVQVQRDLESIAATTAAAVNASSRSDLDLDHGVLVLVGDRRQLLEQLAGLPLPTPEECDAQGRPVVH
ncbi:MAG TPA: pitrilysin family protein [Planctomycetota bacterium]|nr:pitrilysin family protein [Planctomycetota bacterium]